MFVCVTTGFFVDISYLVSFPTHENIVDQTMLVIRSVTMSVSAQRGAHAHRNERNGSVGFEKSHLGN